MCFEARPDSPRSNRDLERTLRPRRRGEEFQGEDSIFNGANDNASSVAGMIEAAAALRSMKPRRTVAFIAFFGEEKGLSAPNTMPRIQCFRSKKQSQI